MNDNTSQINTDNGFEFHMEEFKQLKEEMRQFQRTRLQLEIFTISAAGLLVAFFVTNKSLIENSSAEFIWWSPLLVLYFGLIWTRTQTQRNMEIGAYLARVEARFGLPELGWERTIAPLKVASGRRDIQS